MRIAVLYLLQEDQTRCWLHCSGAKCRVSGRAHHLLQGSGCGVHLLFVQDRGLWLWCPLALYSRSPICSLSRSQMVLADSPISMATRSLPPTSRGWLWSPFVLCSRIAGGARGQSDLDGYIVIITYCHRHLLQGIGYAVHLLLVRDCRWRLRTVRSCLRLHQVYQGS